MFTRQKIGKTIFVSLYFDKIFYHANAMAGMYVNAHKNDPLKNFLSVHHYFSTKIFHKWQHVRQDFNNQK